MIASHKVESLGIGASYAAIFLWRLSLSYPNSNIFAANSYLAYFASSASLFLYFSIA